MRFVTFQSSDNVGHITLEFSPAPLSMLEMQTQSMENNFLNNIEPGERGEFFSKICVHGCLRKTIALRALVMYITRPTGRQEQMARNGAFVRAGVVDERETEMMKVRWRIFHLNRQIRQEDQRKVPPCGKCFARFVLIESASSSGGEEEGCTPLEKHCARNRSKNFLALDIKL